MYVHVICDDPQDTEEAASNQEAAAGEALVAEAAQALSDYVGRGGAFGPGCATDEVYWKVQDLPIGTEPRGEEWCVVWKDDL